MEIDIIIWSHIHSSSSPRSDDQYLIMMVTSEDFKLNVYSNVFYKNVSAAYSPQRVFHRVGHCNVHKKVILSRAARTFHLQCGVNSPTTSAFCIALTIERGLFQLFPSPCLRLPRNGEIRNLLVLTASLFLYTPVASKDDSGDAQHAGEEKKDGDRRSKQHVIRNRTPLPCPPFSHGSHNAQRLKERA
ncbi:hypothetical protein CEXT_137021 [Caerostris extrusa]|uniref:Uncharacterized protein n=1 Tax=Caerostris extrusa TaxID=172846 RepID=A0AAV4NY30_CAEEX|nr:hypothetical protein CEXT_137021 [Caerostris extrusa]